MVEHYIDAAANPAWIREQLAIESEGERSPIQIRADFERHGFCLFAGGEAVGATSTYKRTWLNREWLREAIQAHQ
jgi:hypothetical protein